MKVSNMGKLLKHSMFLRRKDRYFSINKKLLLSFMSVVLLMTLVGAYPLIAYEKPLGNYNLILDNIIAANDTLDTCFELQKYLKDTLREFTKDSGKIKDERTHTEYSTYIQKIDSNITVIKKNHRILGISSDNLEVKALSAFENKLKTYKEHADETISPDDTLKIGDRSKSYEALLKQKDIVDTGAKDFIAQEISYSKAIKAQTNELIRSTRLMSMLSLLIIIVVCTLIACKISKSISKPIKKISQAVKSISQGNLTADIITVKSNNELRLLSDSFNNMVVSLKNMIKKVNESSEKVVACAINLNAGVTQSTAASEEASASIQSVAEGTGNQFRLSAGIAESILDMDRNIHEVAENSSLVENSSKCAGLATLEGNTAINEVIKQINIINSTILESAEISSQLYQESQKINEIAGAITDISRQSNLLSFNASIEAARAGEQGKGFAVVANEVKKLADQSVNAANKITSIITGVQSKALTMKESMEKSIFEISSGIKLTQNAEISFNKISETNITVDKEIRSMNSKINKVMGLLANVKDSSRMIAGIAESSAEDSDNIAASMEEMTAGLEEVTATSDSLNTMAEELGILVKEFTV